MEKKPKFTQRDSVLVGAVVVAALILEHILKSDSESDESKLAKAASLCSIVKQMGKHLMAEGYMEVEALSASYEGIKTFAAIREAKHEELLFAKGLVEKCDDLLDMKLSEEEKIMLVASMINMDEVGGVK